MKPLSGTLGQIALSMELYLRDPLGEAYWQACDEASEAMMVDVEATFLAAATNYKISQISWASIHISENWASWFSSQVMGMPLEGH